MKISNISSVFFSATYTTRKIVRQITGEISDRLSESFAGQENCSGEKTDIETKEYDITEASVRNCHENSCNEVILKENELLIVGMPVYAGRIQAGAARELAKFKGKGSPAVICGVYGNRDYDDALLEMCDTLESNGFRPVSAGAFIAAHSIFPKIGTGRPDAEDILKINEFAVKSADIISGLAATGESCDSPQSRRAEAVAGDTGLKVRGNRPYKILGKVPVYPKGDRKCSGCKACAKVCPAGAIDPSNPKKTDTHKCISCGRCVVVCPEHSRRFRGLLYKIAENKFIKAYSGRKEPDTYYCI